MDYCRRPVTQQLTLAMQREKDDEIGLFKELALRGTGKTAFVTLKHRTVHPHLRRMRTPPALACSSLTEPAR